MLRGEFLDYDSVAELDVDQNEAAFILRHTFRAAKYKGEYIKPQASIDFGMGEFHRLRGTIREDASDVETDTMTEDVSDEEIDTRTADVSDEEIGARTADVSDEEIDKITAHAIKQDLIIKNSQRRRRKPERKHVGTRARKFDNKSISK